MIQKDYCHHQPIQSFKLRSKVLMIGSLENEITITGSYRPGQILNCELIKATHLYKKLTLRWLPLANRGLNCWSIYIILQISHHSSAFSLQRRNWRDNDCFRGRTIKYIFLSKILKSESEIMWKIKLNL